MKNGSNKILKIAVCAMMTLLLVAFFPWNMPKLINADKPFIDLAGSVGESIGNANEAYEKATSITPIEDPEITKTPLPTSIPDDIDSRLENVEEIRIVIGAKYLSGPGETIFINDIDIGEASNLTGILKNGVFEGKTIILFDNYAETNTYREIKRLLNEAGKEFREEAADLSGSEFINESLR